MSAPVAPNSVQFSQGEENEMAAANLRALPQDNERRTHSGFFGGIAMTIQKAATPSVNISPAVIGLLLTIAVQLGVTIWWASGISKDLERNKQDIIELKSVVETQKVYIDNSREKQVKLEAAVENLEKQQQQMNLLLQMKGTK